jgi:membrane-bound lytic murein transglycosylase A
LGLFDPALAGRTLVGRVRNGTMEPYPVRADISEDAAPILAWGNAADVFFLQVQGSGRLLFPDGTQMRAAFAAHNGHPFRSIGAELIRRGALTRDQASADAIKTWMANNGPDATRELINTNPRTVFFKLEPILSPKEGPKGGQGVPLTAGASLAVDSTLHPYGLPIIVDADAPVLSATDAQRQIRRLVVTQDTGGAIVGPLRGDLFWGTGAAAGLQAGRVNHSARWWVLLPLGLDPVVAGSSR